MCGTKGSLKTSLNEIRVIEFRLDTGKLRVIGRSRDRVVTAASMLCAEQSWNRIPVGGWEVFLCSPNCPDQIWGPLIIVFSKYRVSFSRVKRPEREVIHPYNIEVKIVGAVLLLLLHAFFIAWTGTTLPFTKF